MNGTVDLFVLFVEPHAVVLRYNPLEANSSDCKGLQATCSDKGVC